MSWARSNKSLVVPSAWRKMTHSRTLPVIRSIIRSARTHTNYPQMINRGKVRFEVPSHSRTGEGWNVCRCRGGGVSYPGRRGSEGPSSSSYSSLGWRLVTRGAEAQKVLKHQGKPSLKVLTASIAAMSLPLASKSYHIDLISWKRFNWFDRT